jgi:predicted site-specific integrase-resolvase
MTVPAYVDIARLCRETSLCERTVDAWVRQGRLPAPRQRGGKRLWKWAEVERYLDDGAPGVVPPADPEAERIKRDMQRILSEESRHGK